ncbi:LD-carboxypeptidase [Pikeienuella piscinae]|uniref:LD-carboxypeptidase n=1 Tax=Pikeienuella piscinae TaxID=2748098 RepID=A0A7L5BXA9_9RHOB|nr:LD-carboxypeptidase [Pikeienuella piscinae]QIE56071.1 LD-carboxypeptidase [Pikeienuella piscinae]
MRLRPLEAGDLIGLTSPSFRPDPSVWRGSRASIEAHGYGTAFFGEDEAPNGRYAGAPEMRAAHLMAAFEDTSVAAVICTRGGAGASDIIDHLDFDRIAANPKPFVGYSDATALLMALGGRAGTPVFHGPMAVDLAKGEDAAGAAELFAMLAGARDIVEMKSRGAAPNRPGVVAGRVVGGNLAVLESLIGTPEWDVPEGAILLLEDINEYGYRVERALGHLGRAGVLSRCAAVLFGRSVLADDPDPAAFVRRAAARMEGFAGPLAFDLPFGHAGRQATIPLGVDARLEVSADGARLTYEGIWRRAAAPRIAAE